MEKQKEGMDWIHLAQDEDEWWGPSEHGTEPSGFLKCWEFLDQQRVYQFLKKDSGPWNLFVCLFSQLISASKGTVQDPAFFVLLPASLVAFCVETPQQSPDIDTYLLVISVAPHAICPLQNSDKKNMFQNNLHKILVIKKERGTILVNYLCSYSQIFNL